MDAARDSIAAAASGDYASAAISAARAQEDLDPPATQLPIFRAARVEMQFSVSADFVAGQVANNVLVLALQTGRIMRIDLDSPEDVDDIDLPRKASEVGVIRRLFLDPTASHLLIATTMGEVFYLHMQSRTPKALGKLRGHAVECVAWNPSQPTASTREILVGAADGSVYETYVESTSEFYRGQDRYLRTVYRADGPVTGIWTDTVPGKPDMRRVLVATSSKLLHFIGRLGRQGHEGSGSIFARLFDTESPAVHNMSAAAQGVSSMLTVTPESGDSPVAESSRPERIFAWLSSQGILVGKLLLSPTTAELGNLLFRESRTLPLPRSAGGVHGGGGEQESTSLIALTQWHVLQLVGNRIIGTNRLDDSVVFNQTLFDSAEKPLSLLADLKKNTFWMFTSKSIFEIEATDEDRDIWKVMLRAERFEEALQYANNTAQKDAIATASGDYLIKKGQYTEAANVYGNSTKPFEQVALKFLDLGERDALRKYLLTKLAHLKKSAIMQRIMVASWLTELFMSKLNSLEDIKMTRGEGTEAKESADVEAQLKAVRREFQEFVNKNKEDLDQKTVYDIISSHGREDELLYFSTAINDFNYVLQYWVQRENWTEALKALSKQTDPEVIYKNSSVLMANSPQYFVDLLMRQAKLDARKLIPAFLNYNQLTKTPLAQNQAVRYLVFEINQHGSTDSAVHNTLLSIYAAHPSRDETALLAYLEAQSPATTTSSSQLALPYDADFALRLCLQHARVRACVLIYRVMGQHTAGVDLALAHNETELAIALASRPEHDAPTRKKLWLSIARAVVSSTSAATLPTPTKGPTTTDKQQPAGIATALALLRRAPPGVLRIEDLLPLFPDFVRVDAFKDEICAALETYSRDIDALKAEMDASAAAADRIRADAAALQNRWVLLEPGEACGVCGEALLQRRFWVWACGHGAHADCAEAEVGRRGGRRMAGRVRELRGVLEQGAEGARRERAVRELDEAVGASCPVCGEMKIRSVDEGFVTEADEQREWDL